MHEKHIFAIDLILIVGTLLTLILLVGYSTPLVISPIDNLTTNEAKILFSIENAQTLLIDDNIEFTSPEVYNLKEGMTINLEPGIYYWKAQGITKSQIRTLTIQSTVILELRESGDKFNVINAGNTVLNVKVYNNTNLVNNLELLPSEESEFSGNKLVGGIKS